MTKKDLQPSYNHFPTSFLLVPVPLSLYTHNSRKRRFLRGKILYLVVCRRLICLHLAGWHLAITLYNNCDIGTIMNLLLRLQTWTHQCISALRRQSQKNKLLPPSRTIWFLHECLARLLQILSSSMSSIKIASRIKVQGTFGFHIGNKHPTRSFFVKAFTVSSSSYFCLSIIFPFEQSSKYCDWWSILFQEMPPVSWATANATTFAFGRWWGATRMRMVKVFSIMLREGPSSRFFSGSLFLFGKIHGLLMAPWKYSLSPCRALFINFLRTVRIIINR